MSYFRFSVGCGGEWTRTTELRRGQIYSLLQLPLCDSPKSDNQLICYFGFRADEGTRTPDRLITNQLLYQLSYIGFPFLFQITLFVVLRLQKYYFFQYWKIFFTFFCSFFCNMLFINIVYLHFFAPSPLPRPSFMPFFTIFEPRFLKNRPHFLAKNTTTSTTHWLWIKSIYSQ